MLVVTLFVVTPLASSAIIGSEIMLCFVAVLTITGVAVVSGRRGIVLVVITCSRYRASRVDWVSALRARIALGCGSWTTCCAWRSF